MPTRIIFSLFLLILAGESQPPWFGTWELNASRSTTNPESRFKRVTLKIEPRKDGLAVIYDMIGTRGGITHMEWIGQFDGRDYPVQGLDYVLTNAYTIRGEHDYDILIKVDGNVAATASVTVSPDGKTLTSTTSEKNAR